MIAVILNSQKVYVLDSLKISSNYFNDLYDIDSPRT